MANKEIMPQKTNLKAGKAQISFATNVGTLNAFRAKCKSEGLRQNEVLEAMMLAFIEDKLSIKVETKFSIETKA